MAETIALSALFLGLLGLLFEREKISEELLEWWEFINSNYFKEYFAWVLVGSGFWAAFFPSTSVTDRIWSILNLTVGLYMLKSITMRRGK